MFGCEEILGAVAGILAVAEIVEDAARRNCSVGEREGIWEAPLVEAAG